MKSSDILKEIKRIAKEVLPKGARLGELISPVIYTKEEWGKCSFTPFYKNVEQDGIVLV